MMRFEEEIVRLPGLTGTVQDAAERLANRHSVMCLTGRGVAPEVVERMVEFHYLMRERMPVVHQCGPGQPSLELGRLFDRDLEAVLEGRARLSDDDWTILHLRGLDALGQLELNAWIDFIARWARRQNMALAQGEVAFPPLLAVLRGNRITTIPSGITSLAMLTCFERLGPLELQLLVRLSASPNDSWSQSAWREYVIPALAVADVELALVSWDHCLGGEVDLVRAYAAVAHQRGWREDVINRIAAPLEEGQVRHIGAGGLHHAVREAIADGIFVYSREYGLELSACALTASGRKVDFERRMWRGHARLVLPLIDQIRFWMCCQLQERLATGWQLRTPPASDEELHEVERDPLACQLGHLEAVLRSAHSLAPRQKATWQRLARAARTVRNTLAHYRPVDYPIFEALLKTASEAGMPVGAAGVPGGR